eukprot:2971840-Rhodomonas_salina.1
MGRGRPFPRAYDVVDGAGSGARSGGDLERGEVRRTCDGGGDEGGGHVAKSQRRRRLLEGAKSRVLERKREAEGGAGLGEEGGGGERGAEGRERALEEGDGALEVLRLARRRARQRLLHRAVQPQLVARAVHARGPEGACWRARVLALPRKRREQLGCDALRRGAHLARQRHAGADGVDLLEHLRGCGAPRGRRVLGCRRCVCVKHR